MDEREDELKATLHRYLQVGREAVLWKAEGLSEYDARRPLTPTGTSMLGVVTHLAWVDCGYFGACFGRPFPEPEPWDFDDPATDPNADLVPDPRQSKELILDFYRRAAAWSDETIESTPLAATGTVPWWHEERRHPTLHTMLVHMATETHRHAGHLDILREQLDGLVGMRAEATNVVEGYDWPAHVARVQEGADRFR